MSGVPLLRSSVLFHKLVLFDDRRFEPLSPVGRGEGEGRLHEVETYFRDATLGGRFIVRLRRDQYAEGEFH